MSPKGRLYEDLYTTWSIEYIAEAAHLGKRRCLL